MRRAELCVRSKSKRNAFEAKFVQQTQFEESTKKCASRTQALALGPRRALSEYQQIRSPKNENGLAARPRRSDRTDRTDRD